MKPVGGILQDNDFFIYGYSENNKHLIFIRKLKEGCVSLEIENINEKLSCKSIEGENFICAMIINNKLDIYCLKYNINIAVIDSLEKYTNLNSLTYTSISSFGLYDTNENKIKLLCRKNNRYINCEFFEIKKKLRVVLLKKDSII